MYQTIFFLLIIASGPLFAANTMPETESELADVWGSVLYCRAIYDEPAIRNRIYQGDRDSCNNAHRMLGMHALETFSDDSSQAIFGQAQRKAAVIRYNTRSVQEAVGACRELCQGYND